jgi:S1-C subfamily serine protease
VRARLLPALLALFALTSSRADDALTPDVVDAVKKATVFVRVEMDGRGGSGSGFVVSGNDQAVMIATNHHVIAPDLPGRLGKPPVVTVVFDSGTKTERSYPASVVASDSERDLAILRVTGAKSVPKPIPVPDTLMPFETMPVYSFGFPFGKALASDNGNPSVTVGKASVSSLRNGPDGELVTIQIDGNLNPGNSGGPVVDSKGRLVGVAVATLRDGHGIGFIVPAGDLGQMLKGRVGRVKVTTQKGTGDKATAHIEATLLDPTGGVKAVSARYLHVPAKAKRPTGDSLDKMTGTKTVTLKVEQGVAVGEVPVPAADGELLVQVSIDQGGKWATAKMRSYLLAPGGTLTGKPPAGWKEYTPRDQSFVVWVPEKAASQSDRERTRSVDGRPIRVNTVSGKTIDGLGYEAQSILMPFVGGRADPHVLQDLIRDAVVAEVGGRVTDTKDVQFGPVPGVEFTVESGRQAARVRLFVMMSRVCLIQVNGSPEQVAGAEAEMMLNSFRLPDRGAGRPGAGAMEPVSPTANAPTVVGGNGGGPFGGPAFKDLAPAGGLLVGVEVVIGRPYYDELVRSVRPIYRVGERESKGKQFGTVLDSPRTLKAKAGYAVGGITAKARNVCDGFSLTFMKVVNGKLDPADSYESEWVGWNGPVPAVKAASDGTPVVGLTGRANDKDLVGLGVLFKGQEKAEPVAPSAAGASPVLTGAGANLRPQVGGPTILGGAFDPAFTETAPDGGMLVGLEIGLAPAFGRTMTRAIRAIYRVGDKEVFGEQRGIRPKSVVVFKAEEGYAVGAVSVMHGLGFDGISVTFMKVVNGKLDPKDSYESDYVGSDEKKPLTKLGGDGSPILGIVGKTNATELTGFGLLKDAGGKK